MNINAFLPCVTINRQVKVNKNSTCIKIQAPLERDTVSFGERTYENTDPNTQLYRGVGKSEIIALCNGETLLGSYYATSNNCGYRSKSWSSRGGYGQYFIAFDKNKIEFSDHRDYDADTRYLVKPYNIADVETIRKGQNNHGELIYSRDFENDKKKDILAKQKDIKDTLIKLKNPELTQEEQKKCIGNLESYSNEFPKLKEAIETIKQPKGSDKIEINEEYYTPCSDIDEDKELILIVKSLTPQKVEEFGQIRDIGEKCRLVNASIDLLTSDLFSENYKEKTAKELQEKMKEIKLRLKALMNLDTKNKVTEFEIKSLQQILENYQIAMNG